MTTELARYEADGTEVVLTDDDIRWVLAKNQNVTNEELKMFVELCVAHKLNPFIKEAYIIKYGNQPATLVIGKEVWVKRAMRNPRYRGHQAGLTFIGQDGRIHRREGSMLMQGEQLIGAWAKVYLKGYEVPLYDEVSFDEYAGRKKDGSLNGQWSKMPATMLRKTALVHVLREAFPEEFGGCYDAAEMGVESSEYESDDAIRLDADAVTIEDDGREVARIPVYDDLQEAYGVPDYDPMAMQEIDAPPEQSMGEEARWEAF